MNTNSTYREVLNWASSFLVKCGREGVGAEVLLKERLEWSKTDLILHLSEEMPSDIKYRFLQDVAEHGSGIPIQHLLGYEWFYGYQFKVTKDTLIPRPETEEIVDKFLQQAPKDQSLKVLDIGTGTGAIAITVKKERPAFDVTAVDISRRALDVAIENSETLNAKVRFLEGDLSKPVQNEKFDVVLSNPPYISEDETELMDDTVLNHEPSVALFAANKGLAIYERMAHELPAILNPKGQIYLEIGYKQGEAVMQLFRKSFPQAEIDVTKDMSGNDRLVRVLL